MLSLMHVCVGIWLRQSRKFHLHTKFHRLNICVYVPRFYSNTRLNLVSIWIFLNHLSAHTLTHLQTHKYKHYSILDCVRWLEFYYIFFSSFLISLQFSENPDNQSLSVLTYTPSIDDDGKYLTCRAHNPHIENSAIEDRWSLVVYCK